jgi:hypothetical protein
MPDTDFIGGPYSPPKLRGRTKAFCVVRGDVTVAGWTDAPIRWPYHAGRGGVHCPLVLCGDLVAAIHTESSIAIQHHWGVSRSTVMRWRRLLGVVRFTAGTAALWRRQWPLRLGYAGSRKGADATRDRARARREAAAKRPRPRG